MEKSKEELGWNFNIDSFTLESKKFISPKVHESFRQFNRKVREMKSVLLNSEASVDRLEQCVEKFHRCLKSGTLEQECSARDLRILIQALTVRVKGYPMIINSNGFSKLLELERTEWKDSFLKPAIKTWFNIWGSDSFNSREYDLYTRFVFERARSMNEKNSRFDTIISNFLALEGPNPTIKMAKHLLQKEISLFASGELFNMASTFSFTSFFTDLGVSYLKLGKSNIWDIKVIDQAIDYLKCSNNGKITLLWITELLLHPNYTPEKELVSEKVRFLIINSGLNPWKPQQWSRSDLTKEQNSRCEEARLAYTRSVNKKFISLLFNKYVVDTRRKDFWLKYIGLISEIFVVGNRFLGDRILQDSKLLHQQYISTSSNQSIFAIVIQMQNHIFVEFSETGGALQVYTKNVFPKRLLNKGVVSRVEEFKRYKSDEKLIDIPYNLFDDYGWMSHSGYWEERLTIWFKLKYKEEVEREERRLSLEKRSSSFISSNREEETFSQYYK